MTIKLIVSGLSGEITEENLFDLFEVYGHLVDAELACDDSKGASLGFGYLYFESETGAARARLSADGQFVGGQQIFVRTEKVSGLMPMSSGEPKVDGGAQLES